MSNERRLLPPMGALNSFAAAAVHGSFARAGEEVGLTPSAVSRQIAVLEDWLQTPLFDRKGRRVELNEAGESYAAEIEPALGRIRNATAGLIRRRPDYALNIATLPSFGMRWLAPRLPRLTLAHPELMVNFSVRSIPFSFLDDEFDFAIHFGQPNWQGAGGHDFLFREITVPVCAPAWLDRHQIRVAADLLDMPLLFQTSRRDAWQRWFAQAGFASASVPIGPSFEHFLMLAQGGAAGSGVALIPSFLIQPELAAGTLVCPLDLPLATDDAYYLVHPPRAERSPAVQNFRDWMLQEAQQS